MSSSTSIGRPPISYKMIGTMFVLLVYVAATLALAHSSNYDQGLLLVGVSFSILALSLDLVAGMLGLFSLGHAGLFAIGAYTTAILVTNYHWSVFEALPVVLVAGGLIGMFIGALTLRVGGLYFAITTYVFTLIVTVVISDSSITGGYEGLIAPTFPNFPSALSSLGTSLVWGVSGALLVTVVVIWSIRSSALYPVLLATRDAELFAASAGVRTSRIRVLMFSLSAALAGLAGWTFCFLGFITPAQFNGTATINILVMVILGGINTRLGPIIGALFISLFPVLVSWNPLWQEIFFGAVLLFVIAFFPEGFVGIIERLVRLVTGRSSSVASLAINTEDEPVIEAIVPTFRLQDIANSEFALEARNIGFSYLPGVKVLKDIDFVVRTATIHGLIGPNGSGKSTLVDLLAGQLTPTEGTITLNGRRVETLRSSERPKLGLMRTFQTAMMVREMSTEDNVTVGLFHKYDHLILRSLVWPLLPSGRRDSRKMKEEAREGLRSVGLGQQWPSIKVADIPHGVEQLTQLAAACVGTPSVLILDEPLAGLSASEVGEVAIILRTLRDSGVTVLVVEHQTRFIFDVCDEVTVLAGGQLVKSGQANDVRLDVQVREVYLGQ